MNLKKIWGWLIFPLILVCVAVGIAAYVINNPADSICARMLNERVMVKMAQQHIIIVIISSLMAIAFAVPVGILISRPRYEKIAAPIINIVNIGQTVPSLAVIALSMGLLGTGFAPAVFALWVYSLLPILRNTYAGFSGIDPSIIEAAKGMGMSPSHIMRRVEIPLALPVIMAGIRTAAVINIGTATLATFIGAGGFGDLIVTGTSLSRTSLQLTGAAMTALLAIFADHILGQIETNLIKY